MLSPLLCPSRASSAATRMTASPISRMGTFYEASAVKLQFRVIRHEQQRSDMLLAACLDIRPGRKAADDLLSVPTTWVGHLSCVRSAANLGKLVRKRAPSQWRPCRQARCHYRAAPTRLHCHSVVPPRPTGNPITPSLGLCPPPPLRTRGSATARSTTSGRGPRSPPSGLGSCRGRSAP